MLEEVRRVELERIHEEEVASTEDQVILARLSVSDPHFEIWKGLLYRVKKITKKG